VADLPVDETLRDQLENLDLTRRRGLLELPQRSGERNHLGVALAALRSHLVETARVVDVTGQDLFALCSVHDNPRIGVACAAL